MDADEADDEFLTVEEKWLSQVTREDEDEELFFLSL